MKTKIASVPKIAELKNKWGFDAYEEGIVVRDNGTGREETVPVGQPGHPVKEGFKANLENNPGLPEKLGRALTGDVYLFGGAMVVQIFEGGAQFYDPGLVQTS